MTEPDPYGDVEHHQSTRRYVRRRGKAGALFFPLGLIPALGLALLTLFALFPFAHGVIEDRAEFSAREALQQGGESWASVSASGQWVTLEGEAPSAARAERAMRLVREARAATALGSARPVTRIRDLTTISGAQPPEPPENPPAATPDESITQPEASRPSPIDQTTLINCNQRLARLLDQTQFEFASGSANVGNQNTTLLDELTAELNVCPGSVLIAGHTDSTGSDTTNQFLSRSRAEAVRDALLARGISADRVSARGFGSSQPLATNTTTEGRARNRRIEIEISASEMD